MKSLKHYLTILCDRKRVAEIMKIRCRAIRERGRSYLYTHWPYELYICFYPAFWGVHKRHHSKLQTDTAVYISAYPNVGAGKGHQIWNWICGKQVANYFDLPYAYLPLPSQKWDSFMGLREADISAQQLKDVGYKFLRMPLFDLNKSKEKVFAEKIVNKYRAAGASVVLCLEQDQAYKDPDDAQQILRSTFWNASARKDDTLIFGKEHFNLGVHLRRGDILNNEGFRKERFQDNQFFVNALNSALAHTAAMGNEKDVHIYVFGQGTEDDFAEFKEFPNIHFCLEMDAKDSYIHMCYLDMLVTGISSFSYEPGLISSGVKFYSRNDLLDYPKDKQWIELDSSGKPIISQPV